jgi:hypothetical protein
MNLKFLVKKVIGTTAALALLVGCQSDDATTSPTPARSGQVVAVHASPDAPAVDLLVNNSVVAAGLAFPNNTDYLTISAGTQNVKVRVAGTTTTVIDANVTIAANANYSVFAADSVSRLTPVVLTDHREDLR